MLKKFLFSLAALALLTLLAQGREVLDSDGKSVQIPDKIERATPMIGAFVQMSAMLGNESKIISGASRLPPLMKKIFPKIRLNDNQSGMLGSSVETLIASNTQVVFGPVGFMFDENAKKQLETAGIAVVKIDKFATYEQIKQSLLLIAAIFGDESVKKAREFNAYFDENVNFVRGRTAKIKDKKRVLMLNFHSGNYSTISSFDIGAEYIAMAGGVNLSSELNEKDFKLSKTLNEEQVLIFDPDIIVTNASEGAEVIAKNPAFKGLKAVKNKQIFVVPSGVYLWSVRSAEGALYPLWLGKVFYPELFADLNLEQKVREFYERFYNYKLSENELKGILNPK